MNGDNRKSSNNYQRRLVIKTLTIKQTKNFLLLN